MSCAIKENLTPENYQEIKTKLENENLESFPSVFQQARIGNYPTYENYTSYYNPELQHIVETFYAQDFEMFNYNPDIIP